MVRSIFPARLIVVDKGKNFFDFGSIFSGNVYSAIHSCGMSGLCESENYF